MTDVRSLRSRTPHRPRVAPAALCVLALALMPALAAGQQREADTAAAAEQARQVMYYPTGEEDTSTLAIEKIMPDEVQAGAQFDYQIRVTNLGEVPIVGLRVREFLPGGFAVVQSQPSAQTLDQPQGAAQQAQQGQQQQAQGQQANQPNQQAQQQQGQQRQQNQQAQQQNQQRQQQAGQQQQQQQGNQSGRGNPVQVAWYFQELMPEQSATINVTGIAGNVGAQGSCITVDYEPSLCTVLNVVNPQLAVTKAGPERIDICEPLTYVYTVANEGTGDAQNVVLVDPLPEGVATADGDQDLEVEVGTLEAGQAREFEVTLVPTRTGRFASRAMARSETDEAYSQEVTTQVLAPQLDVQAQAPEWQYVGERFRAEVVVTNTGEVAARDVTLEVNTPAQNVAMLTPNVAEGEAQLAAAREGAEDGRYEIGTLEPGQSRTITIAMEGRDEGQVQINAVAAAVCEAAQDQARAQATAQTYIATIPALVVAVIDLEDPVAVGEDTIYEVAVGNQGSAADQNIRLTAQLPEGMEFVNAEGPSEVRAEEGRLIFEPLESLAPDEVAEWQVQLRGAQAGQKRFSVELLSESLTEPVISQEPTRVVP